MATEAETTNANSVTLSAGAKRSVSLNAARRKVALLRQACSDYDLETDRIKRDAERGASVEDAPRIRLLVDLARSTVFTAMRARLRDAEQAVAAWRPSKRAPVSTGFGAMVSRAAARKVTSK